MERKEEGMEAVLDELRKNREERKETKDFIADMRKWEKMEEKIRRVEEQIDEVKKEQEERLKVMEEELKKNKKTMEKLREKMEEKWEKDKEKEERSRREEKENDGKRIRRIKEEIMEEGNIRQMVEKGIKDAIKNDEENRERENKEKKIESKRWEDWERERRRNNIIITGLEIEKRIGKKEIEEWLEKEIKVKVKIVRIWVIKGRKMIGAECMSREEKEK